MSKSKSDQPTDRQTHRQDNECLLCFLVFVATFGIDWMKSTIYLLAFTLHFIACKIGRHAGDNT